jgi:gliding motility-associated-like protein
MPGDPPIVLYIDDGISEYSYLWTWNDETFTGETLQVAYEDIEGDEDLITLIVTDTSTTCENSDEIIIEVFKIEIPVVVTPNGDDANDRFEPGENWSGIRNHTMIVFNRWGEKVWESEDFESGWDCMHNGKYVADGTYFWILEYYGPDNIQRSLKGSLTVLGTHH